MEIVSQFADLLELFNTCVYSNILNPRPGFVGGYQQHLMTHLMFSIVKVKYGKCAALTDEIYSMCIIELEQTLTENDVITDEIKVNIWRSVIEKHLVVVETLCGKHINQNVYDNLKAFTKKNNDNHIAGCY